MTIQDATLTIFYFFTGDILGTPWQLWCQQLAIWLGLESDDTQPNIWREPYHRYFLDVEMEEDVTMVRLSLSELEQGNILSWQKVHQMIAKAHTEFLAKPIAETGLMGTTLLFWGLADIEEENSPAWVKQLPAQNVLPFPYFADLPFGRLWQLQNSRATSFSENIFTILVPPADEQTINQKIIYHTAFWQAQAMQHKARYIWHKDQAHVSSNKDRVGQIKVSLSAQLSLKSYPPLLQSKQKITQQKYKYQNCSHKLFTNPHTSPIYMEAMFEFEAILELLGIEITAFNWTQKTMWQQLLIDFFTQLVTHQKRSGQLLLGSLIGSALMWFFNRYRSESANHH